MAKFNGLVDYHMKLTKEYDDDELFQDIMNEYMPESTWFRPGNDSRIVVRTSKDEPIRIAGNIARPKFCIPLQYPEFKHLAYFKYYDSENKSPDQRKKFELRMLKNSGINASLVRTNLVDGTDDLHLATIRLDDNKPENVDEFLRYGIEDLQDQLGVGMLSLAGMQKNPISVFRAEPTSENLRVVIEAAHISNKDPNAQRSYVMKAVQGLDEKTLEQLATMIMDIRLGFDF